MKTTFALTVLSCLVFALAPTNAENPPRKLRAQEGATASPLNVFKAMIEKIDRPEGTRQLRSDEDGKEVIEKFVKAMEKLTGKSGRTRRTEEDSTEYHVDSLLGLVNGKNKITSD